jgi:tRNA(adenine34) deaminase
LPTASISDSPIPEVPEPEPAQCPFEKRFPSQLARDDSFYMSLAYNQAIDAGP